MRAPLGKCADDSARYSSDRAVKSATTCLVVVVRIPGCLTICLSIFIAIFAADGTMILLPFHYPLAVFEFRHGHPGFIGCEMLAPNTRSPYRMTRAP